MILKNKNSKDCFIARLFRFIKWNRFWDKTFEALVLSAYYRLCLKLFKAKKLYKNWGIEGEETPDETFDKEVYKEIYKVSYAVERICKRTAWESRCLVRALTARKMLAHKKIPTTLYLGCKLDENGKMSAHAWLRAGDYYVTGGTGEGYSVVSRFKTDFTL